VMCATCCSSRWCPPRYPLEPEPPHQHGACYCRQAPNGVSSLAATLDGRVSERVATIHRRFVSRR
jgi:hypothetical protein